MQTATISPIVVERADLPSILATLCSYESLFGPYHPQTLQLLATLGIAYWQVGEPDFALPVLERAIRDLGRNLRRDHDLRLRALAVLKDLSVDRCDYERAEAAQNEILQCQIERSGSDHPEAVAARADLAIILLKKIHRVSSREV